MYKRQLDDGDPFRIVLIDMQMPGMDGEALVRAIQADPRLAGIRLVMLTSLGTRGDANRFMAMGFAAYLNKPVRHQELQGILSMTLGGPQTEFTQDAQGHLLISDVVFGQQTGDEVLCELARILRESLKEYDAVGRMGGEEFLVIAPLKVGTDSLSTFDRLRQQIAQGRIPTRAGELSVTMSIVAWPMQTPGVRSISYWEPLTRRCIGRRFRAVTVWRMQAKDRKRLAVRAIFLQQSLGMERGMMPRGIFHNLLNGAIKLLPCAGSQSPPAPSPEPRVPCG